MQRELVLVRHGEAGDPSIYWGVRDIGLSEQGRQTARASVAMCPVGLQSVFCSPQLRAVECATLLVHGTDARIHSDRRLAARDYGDLTGWTKRAVQRQRHPYSTALEKWCWTPPGGESYRDVAARVADFIADVWRATRGPILIVTHESTMKVFAVLCQRSLVAIEQPFGYGEACTYHLSEPPTSPWPASIAGA